MERFLKIVQEIILIFVLVTIALLLFSKFAPNFKYGLYIVKSGSMAPQILAGSVIINKRVTDYQVGDVVTFSRRSQLITHKIMKVVEENKVIQYQTKGQANNSPDVALVWKESVLGKVILVIPVIGYLLIFAKSFVGMILLGILLVGMVFREIVKIKRIISKNHDK